MQAAQIDYIHKFARSQARLFCRWDALTGKAYSVTLLGFWEAGLIHDVEEVIKRCKGAKQYGFIRIKAYIEK